MPASVRLIASKSSVQRGEEFDLTYVIDAPAESIVVTGSARVNGADVPAQVTINLGQVIESAAVPTGDGLTVLATSDPLVFRGVFN